MGAARSLRPVDRIDALQVGVLSALLLTAAAAWVLSDERMAGMDTGPGTDPGALGFFVVVWTVMMAAMMLPSSVPMVLMNVRLNEGRRERGEAVPWGTTATFLGGYLLAWLGAGLCGYGIYLLGGELTGDLFDWTRAGPYLAGGIVLVAAAYQLTPLKDVCLRHCRSPLMFLLEHWRPGRIGAMRMGAIHGGWCIGCCWALMASLFALGVMSIGWMAVIASLIAIEKLLPWRVAANRGIAVVLLILGLGLAFAPERVPGLTVPGSAEATSAMESMDGGMAH
jgi:predicted metal-binding membrane protein